MRRVSRCSGSHSVANRPRRTLCDPGQPPFGIRGTVNSMAIETEPADDMQHRRAWMIEEFQHAQQRRRASLRKALSGVSLPPGPDQDVPTTSGPDDAVNVRS